VQLQQSKVNTNNKFCEAATYACPMSHVPRPRQDATLKETAAVKETETADWAQNNKADRP